MRQAQLDRCLEGIVRGGVIGVSIVGVPELQEGRRPPDMNFYLRPCWYMQSSPLTHESGLQ